MWQRSPLLLSSPRHAPQQQQLTTVKCMHLTLLILSISHAAVHLTLITTPASRYYYYPQFTDEDTEAQRS